MTTWNNGPYPPPDPNQYYGGPQQGGFPPQQPFPGAPPQQGGYPPQQGGYPPQQGGYPPQQGGYPPQQGGYPPQGGYPQGGYPPAAPGFGPPPEPYGAPPGSAGGYTQPDMYGTNYSGGEDGDMKGFDFSDASIRRGFIRKVYMILMVQLSITLGFISLFVYHEPTKRYVGHHPELLIIAFVVFLVSLIVLACCSSILRKVPYNYVFLFLFTIAEGFLMGLTASRYSPDIVLMAVGLTAAVCLGLTLFAFQTKWDFTVMGGILFVAVIILMVFGIVTIFVRSNVVRMVYASLGALIFSIYLIYDTQMMMGGKHKYSISPEEYIFAALNLYIDIINIFMYILTILGSSRD